MPAMAVTGWWSGRHAYQPRNGRGIGPAVVRLVQYVVVLVLILALTVGMDADRPLLVLDQKCVPQMAATRLLGGWLCWHLAAECAARISAEARPAAIQAAWVSEQWAKRRNAVVQQTA